MAHRISIELTSNRGDGSWTWRAAGAREPRGIVAGELLPEGANVNSVFTAEIETGLGVANILSVFEEVDLRNSRPQTETIEVVGTKRSEPDMLTNYKGNTRGHSDKSARRKKRQPKGSANHQNQRRWQKLTPGKQHQNAWLASLPPEQAVVAERLLEGGMQAVKDALAKQNSEAKQRNSEAKQPASSHKPLLELAESLLGEYRSALWHDQIDAVLRDFNKLSLGDIRVVVAASEITTRSAEASAKADEAKQKLSQRVDVEHTQWLADLATHLNEGRLERALKLSGSPPKTGVPLPEDLAKWMVDATADVLTPETPGEGWDSVLQALAFSPVRRLVRPTDPPSQSTPQLAKTVNKLGRRFPHIADLFVAEKRVAEEKAAKEEPTKDKAATEKPAKDKVATEKAATEKPAAEKVDAEEPVAKEKTATQELIAEDKTAKDKVATEEPVKEGVAEEKAAEEKVAAQEPTTEKPATAVKTPTSETPTPETQPPETPSPEPPSPEPPTSEDVAVESQ